MGYTVFDFLYAVFAFEEKLGGEVLLQADGVGEVVLKALLKFGPELDEGEAGVEVNVVGVVHAVLVAFEVSEATVVTCEVLAGIFVLCVYVYPDCATVGDEVELVEETAFVKIGQLPLVRLVRVFYLYLYML